MLSRRRHNATSERSGIGRYAERQRYKQHDHLTEPAHVSTTARYRAFTLTRQSMATLQFVVATALFM